VIEHAKKQGHIEQRREGREQWKHRREFVYEAIVEVEGFLHGLYVEMELSNPDRELPEVSLLNAHPPSFTNRRSSKP
jgi:hypothetical protein